MSLVQQLQKSFEFSSVQKSQEIILKRKGNVFYMFLNRKANTFTHDFLRLITKALNQVEKHDGPTALVTVSLSKLFSGGLDLKYATSLPHQDQKWFIMEFGSLIGKISLLPFPTIALVQGISVAGGCMLSFAHDFIYVADKAMFVCNQVDIGLPLPPGMLAVVKKRHKSHITLRDMCLFGKKFTHQQALQHNIIDGVISTSSALSFISQKAQSLAKYGQNKQNFKKLKQQLYKEIINECFNKQNAVGMQGQVRFPVLPKL